MFPLGFVSKDVIMKGFRSNLCKRSNDNVLFREFHEQQNDFLNITRKKTNRSERFIHMTEKE